MINELTTKKYAEITDAKVKDELLKISKISDWATKLQTLINDAKAKEVWTKLQKDYLADLKKYQITTLEGQDIEAVINELPTKKYAEITDPKVKDELLRISEISDWEKKLKQTIQHAIFQDTILLLMRDGELDRRIDK